MGNFVLIYDSTDSDTTDISTRRAKEAGAQAVGVDSVEGLKKALSQLKRSGVTIDQLHFYTHGEPGTIFFGSSALISTRIGELASQGFEDLFLPDARVVFDGCNVAEVKRGCEIGKNCAATDNGVVFLSTIAKTFLFKGGGRAIGWTSAGIGFPLFGGSEIHHWTGTTVHAFINKGGTRTRIGVGRAEYTTPPLWPSVWEVECDKDVFYYYFESGNKVSWTTGSYYRAGSSTRMDQGTWTLEKDVMRIRWNSSEYETWDLPLFPDYQTGSAYDILGFDLELHARLTHLF